MQMAKTKWFLPLFAVALGLVMLAAQWVGGNPGSGLVSLGILTAFGTLILLGGRTETIRGLRGDGRDERFRMIDVHASATRRPRGDRRDHHRIRRRDRARPRRQPVRLARRRRRHRLPRSDRGAAYPGLTALTRR